MAKAKRSRSSARAARSGGVFKRSTEMTTPTDFAVAEMSLPESAEPSEPPAAAVRKHRVSVSKSRGSAKALQKPRDARKARAPAGKTKRKSKARAPIASSAPVGRSAQVLEYMRVHKWWTDPRITDDAAEIDRRVKKLSAARQRILQEGTDVEALAAVVLGMEGNPLDFDNLPPVSRSGGVDRWAGRALATAVLRQRGQGMPSEPSPAVAAAFAEWDAARVRCEAEEPHEDWDSNGAFNEKSEALLALGANSFADLALLLPAVLYWNSPTSGYSPEFPDCVVEKGGEDEGEGLEPKSAAYFIKAVIGLMRTHGVALPAMPWATPRVSRLQTPADAREAVAETPTLKRHGPVDRRAVDSKLQDLEGVLEALSMVAFEACSNNMPGMGAVKALIDVAGEKTKHVRDALYPTCTSVDIGNGVRVEHGGALPRLRVVRDI
jgi:hypothetical protein